LLALLAERDASCEALLKEEETDLLADEMEDGSTPADEADLLALEREDSADLLALDQLDWALTEATEAADEAEWESEV
jgi:hypothetical protein